VRSVKSKRSQVVVTAHSDVLVDALTDKPESVVICEKHTMGRQKYAVSIRTMELPRFGGVFRACVPSQ
jgi:predicted ATPase